MTRYGLKIRSWTSSKFDYYLDYPPPEHYYVKAWKVEEGHSLETLEVLRIIQTQEEADRLNQKDNASLLGNIGNEYTVGDTTNRFETRKSAISSGMNEILKMSDGENVKVEEGTHIDCGEDVRYFDGRVLDYI